MESRCSPKEEARVEKIRTGMSERSSKTRCCHALLTRRSLRSRSFSVGTGRPEEAAQRPLGRWKKLVAPW